jgi:hypothetical protein
MYSNIRTKKEIIDQFSSWLFDCSELGNEDINQAIAKANVLLDDGVKYDYCGHLVLLNQIKEVTQ